ncbi:MAG: DUF1573 domain-containing protein [Bacteroidales bacterium]|nr:DUF1573 domain-containing protein [Bacteroidales bacterium]
MRRLILLAFGMVLLTSINAQLRQANISFNNESHNFGVLKEEDGPVTHKFEFTNIGSEPLIISKVNASCGCTATDWTKEPVAPGGKGFVSAKYNPANRPGKFNKTVTVTSNSATPTKVLKIEGDVIAKAKTVDDIYKYPMGNDIKLDKNHVTFAKITNNQKLTESAEFINVGAANVNISFQNVPEHISIVAEPAVIQPGEKGKIIITYDANNKKDWGFVIDRVNLVLNGNNDPRNRISISATIEEDFASWTPQQLANAPVAVWESKTFEFDTINQGESVDYEFVLRNEGKSDLIIRKTKASCGCTALNIGDEIIKPGKSTAIKTTFNSRGKSMKQNKTITVITNDPKNSSTILRVTGFVKVP